MRSKVIYGRNRIAVIMQRAVTYEENVTYGPATKPHCQDAGSPGHAIETTAAQFRDCRACSL
jgi:hypothetical protein